MNINNIENKNSFILAIKAILEHKLGKSRVIKMHYDMQKDQCIIMSQCIEVDYDLFSISFIDPITLGFVRNGLNKSFQGKNSFFNCEKEFFKQVANANHNELSIHLANSEQKFYDYCASEAAHIFTQDIESDFSFEDVVKLIKEKDLDPLDVFDGFKYQNDGLNIIDYINNL